MARLKEQYMQDIRPSLQKKLGLSNLMEVPQIKKITLNMGVGEVLQDKKAIEKAQSDMEKLSGQKAIVTRARKSVASFKIREGMPIGVKVTLRKDRMYEFLDRLINIALPRVRDFRGLSNKSFDGTGNYSIGVKEQIIFPEIDYDSIDRIRGLDISITTTAKSDDDGFALLKAFNFPIKETDKKEEIKETEVEAQPEETEVEAQPEETEVEAQPEETEVEAQPEETDKKEEK
jgi:large subunit ribosomal protein L5